MLHTGQHKTAVNTNDSRKSVAPQPETSPIDNTKDITTVPSSCLTPHQEATHYPALRIDEITYKPIRPPGQDPLQHQDGNNLRYQQPQQQTPNDESNSQGANQLTVQTLTSQHSKAFKQETPGSPVKPGQAIDPLLTQVVFWNPSQPLLQPHASLQPHANPANPQTS